VRRRLLIMRERAREIKQANPDDPNLRYVKYAGVCSDYTLIVLTILSKLDVPCRADIGFLVNKQTVTTQHAHSQISIPLKNNQGKRYDLGFDPVNNQISIGKIKIPANQLTSDLITSETIKRAASKIQEEKDLTEETAKRQFFKQELKEQKHKQAVNERVGAIAAKIAGQGLRRIDEKWSEQVLERLEVVDKYFITKIWQELIAEIPKKQAQDKVVEEAVRIINNPEITKEKLKSILQKNSELKFLI